MTVKELKKLLEIQNDDSAVVFEVPDINGCFVTWWPEAKDFLFRPEFED